MLDVQDKNKLKIIKIKFDFSAIDFSYGIRFTYLSIEEETQKTSNIEVFVPLEPDREVILRTLKSFDFEEYIKTNFGKEECEDFFKKFFERFPEFKIHLFK